MHIILKNRLRASLDLYNKKGGMSKIIVTGGDPWGRGVTEASLMKKFLTDNGIPESDIIEETESKHTFGNAVESMPIVK